MRGSSTTVSPRLSVSPGSSSPSGLSIGLSLIRTSDQRGGADVPAAPASMQCRRRPRVPPVHGPGSMTKQGPHEIAAGLWRRRGSNGSAAGIMRNSLSRERPNARCPVRTLAEVKIVYGHVRFASNVWTAIFCRFDKQEREERERCQSFPDGSTRPRRCSAPHLTTYRLPRSSPLRYRPSSSLARPLPRSTLRLRLRLLRAPRKSLHLHRPRRSCPGRPSRRP